MKLPRLKDPQRYVGLFAFDFGEWVSVGYTAEEIAVLLSSERHKHGGAFRVHRADAEGRVELAGVSPYDLSGEEMMLFASSDSRRAGDSFSTLRQAVEKCPPPCSAKLELVEIPQLDPPHAVCLLYPRHAARLISDWLLALKFDEGDVVMGGAEVSADYRRRQTKPIATCQLRGRVDYTTRSTEEILKTVHEPIQR